ncbi:hypothetical protein NMR91_000696 [Vibrio alginolyticus]|uniref:DNA methyltransferase n=1 Tax=Vibrio diabolicus TaxID=50719 RepID=UPI002286A3C4|nr:DNA methyltransferase [Vibrio diabolicus]EJL6781854.1 hypothetical protein [Vibrio alginolyticus]MCZ0741596.1 DNA methyltransferase [Vibrio diabolicus]
MINSTQQLKAEKRRQKFAELLREIFQINQPELDFGLYRIMHARKDDINRFIERDLPNITKEAFKGFVTQDKTQIEQELDKAVHQAKELGVDPDSLDKVKDLKTKLADNFDLAREEGEVYDALVTFFKRYYSEGDFLSRRVYKDGTYAIPYQGEEVILHWANKDQYYIKSSETLRDYTFRLNPEASIEEDPLRVHFKLVDAEAGAKDNIKEGDESKRVFVLDRAQPFELIDGEPGEEGNSFKELQLRFHFRAATELDWTPDVKAKATAAAQKKAPTQDHLRAIAVNTLLAEECELPGSWRKALEQPYRKADGELADYSMLQGHLNNYTKKNSFDYFIHKDLGRFLNRELDFYIKNELVDWADIASLKNDTTRLAPLLSKIEVIRTLGEKVITFLAQLENFQKKLWLKKKFITETNYCLTLDRLTNHIELLDQIFDNEAQLKDWENLYALDLKQLEEDYEALEWSDLLSLPKYRYLMVDTTHFDAAFRARLIATIENLDEQCDGLLVNSENFQAMNLLQERYREQVKCIYIDPPYNTGSDGFLYKDTFQHSSWLTFMHERLSLGGSFLSNDGVVVSNIDDNEASNLERLLDLIFGEDNFIGNLVWKGATDNNPTRIATEHEYIVSYAKSKTNLEPHWSTSSNEMKQLMLDEFERLKNECLDIEEVSEKFLEFAKSNQDKLGDLYRYRRVDVDGPYVARRNMENPGKKGYDYDVVHPKTGKPCTKPYWGWRFSESRMKEFIDEERIIFGDTEDKIPELKVYLREVKFPLRSVFSIDARKGSNNLDKLFGRRDKFKNPKPEELVTHVLPYVSQPGSLVMDFFAGSGTTGHALINLNRNEKEKRKLILVEQGLHFDSVLLPRVKKVCYSAGWKNGIPDVNAASMEGLSCIFKVIRLEAYEDSLGNLTLNRQKGQQSLLSSNDQSAFNKARQNYVMNYMLEVETRDSLSLLNTQQFLDPNMYELKVRTAGGDETKNIHVDLLETFNYLLGLRVEHVGAPTHFDAEFTKGEFGRWKAIVKPKAGGAWWFRSVAGINANGQKVLVVWRNLPSVISGEESGLLLDNAVLDAVLLEELVTHLPESQGDEFDLLYVNGDNNIVTPHNRKREPMKQTRIYLIEEAFHRLMFAGIDNVQ